MEDLSSFSSLIDLDIVGIENNHNIHGSIDHLNNLTNLNMLRIENAYNVNGDIAQLSNLTKLEIIIIIKTSVSGNILPLTSLEDLGQLDLIKNKVVKDEKIIRALTKALPDCEINIS